MNINESIRDWIFSHYESQTSLAVIDLVTMGETSDLAPPFLGIYETGSNPYIQGEVVMYGVTNYDINCELHTVPVEEDQDGTDVDTEREYRRDLYDILGDRAMIDWINNRNGWLVFDIRIAAPTTEASEGRRITRWSLSIIAAPN